jgi:two-component system LytT family response regulator
MKAVIIDDEESIRRGLETMLRSVCPKISSIATASGVQSGLETIRHHTPDFVFLDMEMGDGTGVDLLRSLEHIPFQLVFITAFDRYAVDAFKYSAIDFLLKPVDPEDLARAVSRAEKQMDSQGLQQQVKILNERLQQMNDTDRRIVLRDHEAIHFVRVQDIVRCEADGPYTRFALSGAASLLISRSLGEYDEMLSPMGFIRCHHSHLVNASRVLRMDKQDGGMLVMDNQDLVPVSHRRRELVLRQLAG